MHWSREFVVGRKSDDHVAHRRCACRKVAPPAGWLVFPTPPFLDPTATMVDPRLTRRLANSASESSLGVRRDPRIRAHPGRRNPRVPDARVISSTGSKVRVLGVAT